MYEYRVTVVSPETELRTQFCTELERLGIDVCDPLAGISTIVPRTDLTEDDVVLLHLPTRDSLADLETFAARLPKQPVIVATGVEDARWLSKCLRAGAMQIVILPLRRDEFAETMAQVARGIGAVSATSQIITVAGAQGGQGVTFVACNLAAAVADIVPNGVLLADMSVNFGAVANYLDIEPQYSTLDLMGIEDGSDITMVNQALHRFSDRISVLAAPSDAIGMRRASGKQAAAVLSSLRLLGQAVVVDVPCTYDAPYFTYLTASDKVVLLVEKKVPAVRALSRVVGKLIGQGYPRERIFVTVNRDGTGDSAIRDEDISNVSGLPIRHTIPNDYPVAAGSMNMGKLMNEYAPSHEIWQRIQELAKLVIEHPKPA